MMVDAAPIKSLTVFIDANVFLSFYSYSNDDLDKLLHIKALIAQGLIVLVQPKQIFDEISRNRETKIMEAITEFSKEKLSVKLPILMRDFTDATEFNAACKEAEKRRKSLVSTAYEQASSNTLLADTVIEEILAVSHKIEITDKIYLTALKRNRVGNPPGKGATIGDEINWEALIDHCPDNTDLHIISRDGDYRSSLDKASPKEFLVREWRAKKNARLFLHTELSPFLAKLDSTIQLVSETNKSKAIAQLLNSGSFASTHFAIAELKPYIGLFTASDIDKLVKGTLANAQVHWIITDSDVHGFFEDVVSMHSANIDADLIKEINALLNAE